MNRHILSTGGGISRGAFLGRSAAIFGAATLAQACQSTNGNSRQTGSAGDDPIANARAAGFGDRPILMALNAGITAPNPHNTQAWKFRVLSETSALVYVDESRVLPVTDPTLRQIHIGQGCLLEVAAIAAGGLGYNTNVELFPEGDYAAERDCGRKPIARITLAPAVAGQSEARSTNDPLFAAIPRRHTVRAAYSGPWISESECSELRQLIRPTHTRLDFAIAPDAVDEILKRHYAGFEREVLTRRTAEESRNWFRIGDQEIFSKRDGISLRDNGVQGFERFMLETFFLSTEPEDFFDEANNRRFLARYRADLLTARGSVLFITPGNAPRDWVLAGREYARFQLAATALGFVSRPMSQLLQEFDEMRDLRTEFEAYTGVAAPAKIQMAALLGRGDREYFSPRRPLQSMLES